MKGKVLSEQMICQLEQSVENEIVQDLIATIRDRDTTIAHRDDTIYRLHAEIDARKQTDGLSVIEQQNTIMREALEQIRTIPIERYTVEHLANIIHKIRPIANEALAKVDEI